MKYNADGDKMIDGWQHTTDGDYRPKEAKHTVGDYDLELFGRKVSQQEFDRKRKVAYSRSGGIS